MSELSMFVVIAIVGIIIAIIAIIGNSISDRSSQEYERPEERAGREGEYIAINIIRRVLRNGDVLLTNVDISYDGRKAELDNVIIKPLSLLSAILPVCRGCGQNFGLFRQLIQGFACTPLGSYTLVILLSSCHCTKSDIHRVSR